MGFNRMNSQDGMTMTDDDFMSSMIKTLGKRSTVVLATIITAVVSVSAAVLGILAMTTGEISKGHLVAATIVVCTISLIFSVGNVVMLRRCLAVASLLKSEEKKIIDKPGLVQNAVAIYLGIISSVCLGLCIMYGAIFIDVLVFSDAYSPLVVSYAALVGAQILCNMGNHRALHLVHLDIVKEEPVSDSGSILQRTKTMSRAQLASILEGDANGDEANDDPDRETDAQGVEVSPLRVLCSRMSNAFAGVPTVQRAHRMRFPERDAAEDWMGTRMLLNIFGSFETNLYTILMRVHIGLSLLVVATSLMITVNDPRPAALFFAASLLISATMYHIHDRHEVMTHYVLGQFLGLRLAAIFFSLGLAVAALIIGSVEQRDFIPLGFVLLLFTFSQLHMSYCEACCHGKGDFVRFHSDSDASQLLRRRKTRKSLSKRLSQSFSRKDDGSKEEMGTVWLIGHTAMLWGVFVSAFSSGAKTPFADGSPSAVVLAAVVFAFELLLMYFGYHFIRGVKDKHFHAMHSQFSLLKGHSANSGSGLGSTMASADFDSMAAGASEDGGPKDEGKNEKADDDAGDDAGDAGGEEAPPSSVLGRACQLVSSTLADARDPGSPTRRLSIVRVCMAALATLTGIVIILDMALSITGLAYAVERESLELVFALHFIAEAAWLVLAFCVLTRPGTLDPASASAVEDVDVPEDSEDDYLNERKARERHLISFTGFATGATISNVLSAIFSCIVSIGLVHDHRKELSHSGEEGSTDVLMIHGVLNAVLAVLFTALSLLVIRYRSVTLLDVDGSFLEQRMEDSHGLGMGVHYPHFGVGAAGGALFMASQVAFGAMYMFRDASRIEGNEDDWLEPMMLVFFIGYSVGAGSLFRNASSHDLELEFEQHRRNTISKSLSIETKADASTSILLREIEDSFAEPYPNLFKARTDSLLKESLLKCVRDLAKPGNDYVRGLIFSGAESVEDHIGDVVVRNIAEIREVLIQFSRLIKAAVVAPSSSPSGRGNSKRALDVDKDDEENPRRKTLNFNEEFVQASATISDEEWTALFKSNFASNKKGILRLLSFRIFTLVYEGLFRFSRATHEESITLLLKTVTTLTTMTQGRLQDVRLRTQRAGIECRSFFLEKVLRTIAEVLGPARGAEPGVIWNVEAALASRTDMDYRSECESLIARVTEAVGWEVIREQLRNTYVPSVRLIRQLWLDWNSVRRPRQQGRDLYDAIIRMLPSHRNPFQLIVTGRALLENAAGRDISNRIEYLKLDDSLQHLSVEICNALQPLFRQAVEANRWKEMSTVLFMPELFGNLFEVRDTKGYINFAVDHGDVDALSQQWLLDYIDVTSQGEVRMDTPIESLEDDDLKPFYSVPPKDIKAARLENHYPYVLEAANRQVHPILRSHMPSFLRPCLALIYALFLTATKPHASLRSPTRRFIFECTIQLFNIFAVIFLALNLERTAWADYWASRSTNGHCWLELYVHMFSVGIFTEQVLELRESPAKYFQRKFSSFTVLDVFVTLSSVGFSICRFAFFRTDDGPLYDSSAIFLSLTASLLILELIRMMLFQPAIGPMVNVIFKMVQELMKFIILMIIITAAFAIFFVSMYSEHSVMQDGIDRDQLEEDDACAALCNYRTLKETLITLFTAMNGEFEMDFSDANYGEYGRAALGLFVLFVAILMLNLLVALMATAYSQVEEDKDRYFLLARATAILILEERVLRNALPAPLNVFVEVLAPTGFSSRKWRERIERLVLQVTAAPIAAVLFTTSSLGAGPVLAVFGSQEKRLEQLEKRRKDQQNKAIERYAAAQLDVDVDFAAEGRYKTTVGRTRIGSAVSNTVSLRASATMDGTSFNALDGSLPLDRKRPSLATSLFGLLTPVVAVAQSILFFAVYPLFWIFELSMALDNVGLNLAMQMLSIVVLPLTYQAFNSDADLPTVVVMAVFFMACGIYPATIVIDHHRLYTQRMEAAKQQARKRLTSGIRDVEKDKTIPPMTRAFMPHVNMGSLLEMYSELRWYLDQEVTSGHGKWIDRWDQLLLMAILAHVGVDEFELIFEHGHAIRMRLEALPKTRTVAKVLGRMEKGRQMRQQSKMIKTLTDMMSEQSVLTEGLAHDLESLANALAKNGVIGVDDVNLTSLQLKDNGDIGDDWQDGEGKSIVDSMSEGTDQKPSSLVMDQEEKFLNDLLYNPDNTPRSRSRQRLDLLVTGQSRADQGDAGPTRAVRILAGQPPADEGAASRPSAEQGAAGQPRADEGGADPTFFPSKK